MFQNFEWFTLDFLKQEMLLGGGATAYTSPYISSAVSTSETCSGPPSPTTSPVSLTPLTLVQSLPPPIALDGSHHHQVSISPTFNMQLLHTQIPKIQSNCQSFFAFLGSALIKAARKMLV